MTESTESRLVHLMALHRECVVYRSHPPHGWYCDITDTPIPDPASTDTYGRMVAEHVARLLFVSTESAAHAEAADMGDLDAANVHGEAGEVRDHLVAQLRALLPGLAARDAVRAAAVAAVEHRPVAAKAAGIMCNCDMVWRDVPEFNRHLAAALRGGTP